jgi:trigger factor
VQVNVEQIAPHTVSLRVDVDKDRLEKHMEAAYRKLVRRYRVPGFRPGKAPRPIFERFVGRSVLLEEAINDLVPQAYREAVAESGIEPYEEGVVEKVEPVEDGLHFEARVHLRPKVVLPPLDSITVSVEEQQVTDSMLDETIEQLRLERGTLVPAEEADQDAVLLLEGTVVTDGKSEPFKDVQLRLAEALPEIREGLLGARAGEERTVVYHEDDVPHTAYFKVVSVHRVELPAVDEEFAKSLGHDTLEELRASLTKYIAESLAQKAREEKARAVFERILAEAEVEVPEFLVERQKQHLREHHIRPGTTVSDEELEEEARKEVRRMLVADRLLEESGISVSQEELARAAVAFAQRLGLKKLTEEHIEDVQRALVDEKLTAFLATLGGGREDETPVATADGGESE